MPVPCGPVTVTRSPVSGPVFAVARWPGPGPGPGPGPCHLSCPWWPGPDPGPGPGSCPGKGQVWWRWPGPGPGPSRSLPLPGPGAQVPVPIKRITYAVWPASSNLFQENGGSTLFSKPLVRGKQYCEVGTIIEQKQEPNGCQSQLLDMKTLDVASWAAVSVCSRNTNVTMVWAWMFS